MNKIFKVIWNPATGSYSVASETAKSRGKKSGRSKLLISALVAGGLLSSSGALAQAGLDTGTGVTPAGHNNGTGWIAIGTDAEASTHTTTNGAATAVGYYSKALGMWSTALGAYSESNGNASLALGVKAQSNGDRSISMGASSSASINAGYSIAMGVFAFTDAEYAVALGNESKALGKYSLALGNASQASGESSIALGNTSEASEQNAIALGQGSIASKVNSIALGSNSSSAGENAIALGEGSAAGGSNSLAFGSQSRASGNDSVALGVGATAATDNSVAIGAGSTTDASNTVSVGNSATKRKIVNMAAGAISNTSTDAINGSQLYTISDSVAKRLGGGATVGNDGSISAVSYALKSGTYNNVGDALSGIDNNTLQWNRTAGAFTAAHGSNTTSKITNVAKGTVSATSTDVVNGSQLYDLQQDALLWNGTAFSAAHGTDVTSKITNVTAGELSDTSTDAVNGSQLKATKDDVAANTTNITNLTGEVAGNTTSITNLTDTVNNLGEDALKWDDAAGAFTAAHGTNATNKITNVTAGELSDTSTDAVNGSQLKTTNDNVATNTTNIATNTTNITNLTDAVDSLGDDSLLWNKAAGAFSAAHGTDATSKITNVTAGDLTAGSTDAVNGSQLKTTNDNVATNTTNIATNTTNITNLTNAVDSLGDDSLLWNKAAGAFSAAHGTDATSKITNVTAGDLTAGSTDAVNGSQLKTTNDNVATNTTNIATNTTNITNLTDTVNNLGEDALKWDDAAGAFTAAHGTNATNKISNVQAGIVSSDSTDAINGSQLYGLADSFTSYLGGGADISDTGVLTGPTYSIGGTDYTNVGDALAAINTSFSDSLGDALLWDATANDGAGAFSAGRGVDNTASKITNVANGAISATSSDAINGSQLYTTNKYIADALGGDAEVNADGTITAPTYTIANTDYNNVGEALDALDENALLWDATANNGEGAYNASHDGKASIITNVADGNIGEGSTDAINGSQLFNTNMLIQQNSEVINQLAGNTSETYIEENGAGINYVRTNDTGLTFTDASAQGVGATAVGYNSVASKASSVAIGQDSRSEVETGIALGSSSVSSRLIVKGSRDTSVSEEGVVIGYDTTDGELLGALSIGDDGKYRQIINVADGSEAHDAVTVRQLQNAIGAVATTPTKYYHANSTAEDSLAVGEDSLAMGAKTIVNGNAGIGIGLNTLVLADAINGIAIGSNARANHANSIAMGNGSQTTRGAQTNYTAYNMDAPQNSVGEFSVGSEDGQRQITNVAAGSADTDAVNVGQLKVTDAQVSQNTQSITNLNNQVTNLDTRVTNIENGIGDIVTTGSTKYFKTNTDGVDANAQGKDSVAIGSGSIAAADNSVALGTGSVANEENTISVGSSTNQRRITNVAAGVNATDAVNVSQLKSSEAGGVRYDTKADGSIDYSNITLGGGNGGTTRISNVSAGVNNNDAVNYAQLKQSVQETKQYTDQRMVEMDNKLSKTESKLSGGIASAMAMTGLPQAYTPGASMASIGGGTYNGESAVALGVSMVSANGRWVYKLQGSTNSQGEYSAALGAGIQW
ncbi:YadA-like family protein [Escherichia coli]|uniref:YadA-like family protein n=1 Tax=Escherichia coli TaxID=562 RepID=UPI000B48EA30|nr:YadA-like family protein [Escherichia coli]EFO2220321.1 adhesin [Escherichia coli O11]EIY7818991.1 YadA-like family protein [Escherichia coli]EJG6379600.1 YadA-like family protein [Escherichia coli]EJU4355517.1 YadA-like family protein [Escherichia coli]EJV7204055.1 YadA-like family protein [Escherichia coli]